jgi:hypothetical protein
MPFAIADAPPKISEIIAINYLRLAHHGRLVR